MPLPQIYSERGSGTTVKLYLPRLLDAPVATRTTMAPASPLGSGTETVLVVEDEDEVRAFTADMLRKLGYRILTARDASQAQLVLDQEPAVDILLTDVGLPGGVNGRQLADDVRRRRPTLKIMFMTAYARNAIVHHGRLDPGVELILKPFTQRDAAAKIRSVLDG